MNHETLLKQQKTLVIIQIFGMVLGLYLALADISYYESTVEFLSSLLALPLAFAGLIRLGVRGYQIVRLKFGGKVYDEATGNCFVVARSGLGVAVGLALPIVFVGFVAMLKDVSILLLEAVFVLLLLFELVFFIKDIKSLKSERTPSESSHEQ